MFTKKYVFETRKTKKRRRLLNLSIGLVVLSIAYLVAGFHFVRFADEQNKLADDFFYMRPPDLIVVFTGHRGRIPHALKTAQKYKQPNILITGVYSKNSVDTLLTPLKIQQDFDTNQLEIDYLARNTLENVIATLTHLRKNKELQKVLIISHDYHLKRIKLITDTITTSRDNYDFYFSGVPTDYKKFRNARILYKEVYKYMRTYLFLLLWNYDDFETLDFF